MRPLQKVNRLREVRRLIPAESGGVVTIELLVLATLCVVGLIAGLTAIRDAVNSELSDASGAVQDLNQSLAFRGIIGHSSSSAGSTFQDSLDYCDSAEDVAGSPDNCISFSPPVNKVLSSHVLGHDIEDPATFLDSWRSTMVIDETQIFTSTESEPVTIKPSTFAFHAGQTGGVVTPFIVIVNGDNDFTVVAVGDTVNVTSTGPQTYDFGGSSFVLNPGETIAFGFTNAKADGTGGNSSVIRFDLSTNEIFFTGGPAQGQSGSVSVGSAPTSGAIDLNLNRDYQFEIGIQVCE